MSLHFRWFVSRLKFADDTRLGGTVARLDVPGYSVPQVNEKTRAVRRRRAEMLGGRGHLPVEHSNSRFESIRYANRFESIRFVKKSAFRFTSCHAAFLANLVYSLSQK